jgi:hypothetical protein
MVFFLYFLKSYTFLLLCQSKQRYYILVMDTKHSYITEDIVIEYVGEHEANSMTAFLNFLFME